MVISREHVNTADLAIKLQYVLAFLSICFSETSLPIGFLLALTMGYLTVHGKALYCIPMILMGNDSLGTVILGRLSFYWVGLFCVIFTWAYIDHTRKISKQVFAFFSFAVLYLLHYYAIQCKGEFSGFVKEFSNLLMVLFLFHKAYEKPENFWDIVKHFAIACFTTALHMAVTGGVLYTSYRYVADMQNHWSVRHGLAGCGVGDPNFSGLRLLFGICCVLYSSMKRHWKIIMIAVMAFCIIRTASLTALVIIICLLCVLIILQPGSLKKFKIFFILLLVAALAFGVLMILPEEILPDQLALLQYRIDGVLRELLAGDIGSATTGRTSHAMDNLRYAMGRQSLFMWLFGFDTIPGHGCILAHNTYVDLFVRFGLLGGFAFLAAAGFRLFKRYFAFIRDHQKRDAFLVLVKTLYLLYFMTLSIYYGVEAFLAMAILLFL